MRFCLSCGIAIAPDRLPDGFSPITIRDTQGPPPQKPIGKLLDAHYDGASFPAAPAAGAIAAVRAEPQNRQRVLLRYKRRVSRCCTFQRQGGQSGADRGGGASPPLCGGPSRSADAGTWIRTDVAAYLRKLFTARIPSVRPDSSASRVPARLRY